MDEGTTEEENNARRRQSFDSAASTENIGASKLGRSTISNSTPAPPRSTNPRFECVRVNCFVLEGVKARGDRVRPYDGNRRRHEARFYIAEDTEDTIPVQSPAAKTPVA